MIAVRRCRRGRSSSSGSPARGSRPRWRCGRAGARSPAATPARWPTTCGPSWRRPGSPCTRRRRASTCWRRRRPSSRARACRRRRRWSRRARRQGHRVIGELEIGWRLLANEFIAVTGSNGKTTTVELIGHVHREAELPVVVAGNVGTAADEPAGRARAATRSSSARRRRSSSRTPRRSRPTPRCCSTWPRTTSTATGPFEAYRAAKLRVFAPPAAGGDRGRAGRAGVDDLGGAGRRVTFGAGRRRSAHRDGQLWWRGEPLIDAARHPPARRAQPRERDGRGRRVPRARACPPTRCAQALAQLRRRRRTGSRRSRPSTASSTSTTPRRPTSPRRSSGSSRSRRQRPRDPRRPRQGRRLRAAAPTPSPSAPRPAYLIGEAAAELAAALAATGVAAARLRRPRARGRRRARRRAPRRGRPALARLRLVRPVPLVRGARRPLPRRSSRELDEGDRAGVEARSDGQVRAREEAAATRAPAPADGDLLPARGRRGDGLLGLVGADAAPGPGRRHRLPGQVPRLRRGRPRRDARALARTVSALPGATRRSCC